MAAAMIDTGSVSAWRARVRRIWRQHPMAAALGAVVLTAAMLVTGTILYQQHVEHVAESALLAALWADYKRTSWDAASGRTIDQQNGGVTTSEGQAYTLLRAVWTDDRPTFDRTLDWTMAHLRRPDGLFSWRWGMLPDGGQGILTAEGGENTASDADTDIAFALLMAHGRWHDERYLAEAKTIIPAVWETEVIMVKDQAYLAADNIEKTSQTPTFVMNPSYLAPYAYRVFSRIDTAHPWTRLASDSYAEIAASSQDPLDTGKSAGLPPDWVLVDKTTGALSAPTAPGQTTDFGFDAFRVFWRLGLDEQLGGGAADNMLGQTLFLTTEWQRQGKLLAVYAHDGRPKADYESLALYGGSIGYFLSRDSGDGDVIVRQKLLPLYDRSTHRLAKSLTYYDNNWVWFGLALHLHRLPDLSRGAL